MSSANSVINMLKVNLLLFSIIQKIVSIISEPVVMVLLLTLTLYMLGNFACFFVVC